MHYRYKIIILLLLITAILLGFEIVSAYGGESEIEPVEDIVIETVEVEETPEVIETPTVDPEELELMAHLLVGEAGSDWCTDEMVYYVGSVALNRVASSRFPDTLEKVIFAKGQYACTWDGNFNREPSERHYKIAEDLLLNGSVLPPDVVYQAEFKQGSGVYKKVQNMYFCYL